MGEDLKKMSIYAVAVIIMAAIILAGIAITGQYSKVLRTPVTINASTSYVVTNLTNQSSNDIGTTGQYPFLQDLDGCFNGSLDISTTKLIKNTDYTIDEGTTDGGRIVLTETGSIYNGTAINCSVLSYLADNSNQRTADKFTAGLAIFGTFIAIIILSLIGKLIIGIFKPKG